MKLNLSKEWYQREGADEEGLSVAAGIQSLDSLITEVNQHRQAMARRGNVPLPFAKLINLQRRANHLTMEELAEKAEVDLVELYNIEHAEEFSPEPKTVFKLAETLNLPSDKLFQLSGLTLATNSRIKEEAIRFAARSEPVHRLSQEEREALREFVKYLSEE